MKMLGRMFVVLGMACVFSLNHTDVMATQGCNSVNEWHYCFKKNNKPACPAGCYCEERHNVQAVVDIPGISNEKDVKYACATRDQGKQSALEARGVYYCPEGKTHDTTAVQNDPYSMIATSVGTALLPFAAITFTDVKRDHSCWDGETAYDGSYNCAVDEGIGDINPGTYCLKRGGRRTCPAGCWCEGGVKGRNAVGEEWRNGNTWQTIPVASWCQNHTKYLEDYLDCR